MSGTNKPDPIDESELRDAFAQSHPTMDPADIHEQFSRERRANAAIENDSALKGAVDHIDSSQWLVKPVLHQAADVFRDTETLLLEEQLSDYVDKVLRRLVDATVIGNEGSLEETHMTHLEQQAVVLTRRLILDFLTNTDRAITDTVLDVVADTVTGLLPEI
jgi:hypothetical protein